jgi:hypothetical protein
VDGDRRHRSLDQSRSPRDIEQLPFPP